MKKENLFEVFSKLKIIKKYNYDINKVVGLKDNDRYILYADKKLIRIYRGNLKSTPLICSYIPIENAIFYNFMIDKSLTEKVDLDGFIETKVYEEAGLLDTEQYIIKYKVVDKLIEEDKVLIQCVIVPVSFVEKSYRYILEETGYIDYLSFPAFAYKSLYEEKIIKKGNDLFVVFLYDKIFLTFYSEGELISIVTISGGLNKVYESLQSLKIADFDVDLFKKIVTKKGVDSSKYNTSEIPVLQKIENELKNRIKLIEEQITDIVENFRIDSIDRVFVTSEYGKIPAIHNLFKSDKVLDFEFYEEYNLDRLPVDPFLFLAMLETHYAYIFEDYSNNYSLFLRPPTFFYRPAGQLVAVFLLLVLLSSIYPGYLYIKGFVYNSKAKNIELELQKINAKKAEYISNINKLKHQISSLQKDVNEYEKDIKNKQDIIKSIYEFKFSYLPKSQELTDITYYMDKYKIFLKNLEFKDHVYNLYVYSKNDKNFGKFINDLVNNGFNADFDKIENKNGKYYTHIRIEE